MALVGKKEIMIKEKCFSLEWITKISRKKKVDPTLAEKVICSSALLGGLVLNGLDLVFKGGTCLFILLPEVKRVSIDVDIVTARKESELPGIFDTLIQKSKIFKKWEENERKVVHNIPKRHFKFYYYSSIGRKSESYILLDIFNITVPFKNIVKRSIKHEFIECEKEILVKVPTIDAILSDKLTAFAPNTIGIPYKKDKSMEIIKQLFDLGRLFTFAKDIRKITEVYKKIALIEAGYRNLGNSIDKFLEDTIETSFLISQLDFKKGGK